MMQKDSVISSPSTPSSSLSSQSNLNTSISNTSVQQTTPSSAPLNITINPYHSNTLTQSPAGVLGHKNSLRGTKLARRARSFKDDLFEKISLMRTPTNTLGRSQSPQSPRNKHKQPPTAEEMAKSAQSLDTHVKDISNALKHFRDVILKKKLEVLPGNGTVILETIASMFSVIQSYMLNENSATLHSAIQLVYQSLGKLIKLCDEVMLSDENEECASLNNENVKEIVDLLEDAVRNLALLAQQKLKEKEELAFQYENVPIPLDESLHPVIVDATITPNLLTRPPVEIAGQRTSLPDITLTQKERENLESTNGNPMRVSYSTESILRDTSPPPKPPLPNRSSNPPPLPPKKHSQSHQQQQRQQQQQQLQQPYNKGSLNANLDIGIEYPLDADHLSVRSHSPDENSSQCSLDSAMNHLRDDDECRLFSRDYNILHDEFKNRKDVVDSSSKTNKKFNDEQIEKFIGSEENFLMLNAIATITGTSISTITNTNTPNTNIAIKTTTTTTTAITTTTTATTTTTTGMTIGDEDCINNKAELRRTVNDHHHRHSNESGFVSINSFRTSSQSYSKRSSDFSFQSSNKSSNSSTEITFTTSDNNINEEEYNIKTIATTTTTAAIAATETTLLSTTTKLVGGGGGGGGSGSGSSNSSSSIITKTKNLNHNAAEEYFDMFPVDRNVEKAFIDQFQNTLKILRHNNNNNSTFEEATPLQMYNIVTSNSQSLNDNENNINANDEDNENNHLVPPALPPKIKNNNKDRQPSMYDNYDAVDNINESVQDLPEMRQHHHQHRVYQWQTKHSSLIDPRRLDLPPVGSCQSIRSSCDDNQPCEQPPPLPMKKKHILAYMEICSASTRSIEQHRHTMHAYNLSRNITHSQTMNIVPLAKEEFLSPEVETPPALPPKNYKQRRVSGTAIPPTIITTPPPSPKPKTLTDHARVLSSTVSNDLMSTVCEEITDQFDDDDLTGNDLKQNDFEMATNANSPITHNAATPCDIATTATTEVEDIVNYNNNHNFDDSRKSPSITEEINHLPNIIEEIDITPYLIFKKQNEDGPEVKGGYIDALIVHASCVQKITDNAFSEAFITTFRTFIHPIDVVEKLTHRYTVFFCQHNDQKQKAAKETFSLLVRVVNDLTSTDLTTSSLLTLLMEFVYQLVCAGQLYLAKLLRNKIVEKVTLYRESRLPLYIANDTLCTVINQPSLLDLKSVEIAEQMTLLDAELFQKIEIPEVLLFAKEQCEEKSPNLNKFTEHFNKMSYWARSKILTLSCAKEREKHVVKFIKIMKHLRKMNNYNSYLALLSALDSAPIRRLEWHKSITESLKEYCTLIDSSSSFRAYRQALADTQPPCIPYIGLVLQDLTFVHVGNPDYLKDGFINFSKRWQQYNIIDNMKRFKKCSYPFRRNERIIRFFENFENFLGEEQMWEISETIKPRGKRNVVHN